MTTQSHLQLVQTQTASQEEPRAVLEQQHETVQRALRFIEAPYKDRLLPTGEPLHSHVLSVARTLGELKLDPNALAAALLYHAYETSPGLAQKIREEFGPVVADLAEGVVRMAQIGALSNRGAGA